MKKVQNQKGFFSAEYSWDGWLYNVEKDLESHPDSFAPVTTENVRGTVKQEVTAGRLEQRLRLL